jgi:hypothetical protein
MQCDQVEYAAAEFIWRTKPAVVAVETAFTEAHGASTGAMLTAGEHMQQDPDFRLRMLSQIAAQLDTSQLPENSELWQVLRGSLCLLCHNSGGKCCSPCGQKKYLREHQLAILLDS